ncbi:MAG: glycoside hydrolase family 19 protein [Polyangiales bacterium]
MPVADGSSDGSSETSTPLDTGVSAPDASASLPDAAAMMDASAADASARDASGASSIESLVPRAMFEQIFLHRGTAPCRGSFYTYDAFVQAAREFPRFASEGTDEQRKREVAAFLANISHETTGGWDTAPDGRYSWGLCWIEEGGASPQTAEYCAPSMEYPCAAGQRYYGRGPIQLSWNYNYGQAGRALGLPLLSNPALVATDPVVSFRTAFWFWMTPQAPKPSCHDVMAGGYVPSATDIAANRLPGFGLTVHIINGGIECGMPTTPAVRDRLGFYGRYAQLLGVTQGDNLECATMRAF